MPETVHPLLAGWSDFYVIAGSAAAALTGLQFVVMTLLAAGPPTGAGRRSVAPGFVSRALDGGSSAERAGSNPAPGSAPSPRRFGAIAGQSG